MNTPRAEEQVRLALDAIGAARAEIDRAVQYLAPVRMSTDSYDAVRAILVEIDRATSLLRIPLRFGGGLSLDSEPEVKP